MKFQTLSHHKFRRLHKMIGSESTAHTAGYLELLWLYCQQAGNGPILEKSHVESVCDWVGEPGKLTESMLICGWLDSLNNELTEVHDFADHAPGFVKRRDYMADYMRKYRENKELKNNPVNSCKHLQHAVSTCKQPVNNLLTTVNDPTKPNQTQPNQTKPNQTKPIHNTIHTCVDSETKKEKVTTEQVIGAWNEMAKNAGLKTVVDHTQWHKEVETRIKNKWWRENYERAIKMIPENPFYLGSSNSSWRANIKWFLGTKAVRDILEGVHGGKNSTGLPERPGDNPSSGDFKLF